MFRRLLGKKSLSPSKLLSFLLDWPEVVFFFLIDGRMCISHVDTITVNDKIIVLQKEIWHFILMCT